MEQSITGYDQSTRSPSAACGSVLAPFSPRSLHFQPLFVKLKGVTVASAEVPEDSAASLPNTTGFPQEGASDETNPDLP
jgi:hypothetical protein